MTSVEQDCVFDLFDNAFVRSETLTKDGAPISTLMKQEPCASIIAASASHSPRHASLTRSRRRSR